METDVLFFQQKEYHLNEIILKLKQGFDLFKGNLPGYGARVLLKPNMVKAMARENAGLTDPTILEAIILIGREYGWEISVGDSPAIGSVRQVGLSNGIAQLCERMSVPLIELTGAESFQGYHQEWSIAKELKNFDALINVPKLKGHQQLYMTAAVKNLFGCVGGKRKPYRHMVLGDKKYQFARMLIDNAYQVAPCINILDGIHAMAGRGPVHGEAVEVGLLAMSVDPIGMDMALLDFLEGTVENDQVLAATKHFPDTKAKTLYQLKWIGDSFENENFYFPKERKPISFHPVVLFRYAIKRFWSLCQRVA